MTNTKKIPEQQVHIGLALVVFVKHYPVGVQLAVQKFLQKVSVGLEQNPRVCALAAFLPKLVTDGLAAGLPVELCRKLGEGEGRNPAGL